MYCDKAAGTGVAITRHIRHKHRNYGLVEAEPQEQLPADVAPTPDLSDLPLLPFSCMEPGCPRWGPSGFIRQVDLDEHKSIHALYALLQGSLLYQARPAYPDALPMNNVSNQGQGCNFQQDVSFQRAGNFLGSDGYGMDTIGEQENDFQQYINYGTAEDPLHHTGCNMNVAGGQENDFQQFMYYEPAGDASQYGGFQADGEDEQGNKANDEFHSDI
ncbi:hypothetical protein CHU98_g11391 [Xylaria longipes]|nr:hypothetical protein CHU98_g11391 [Xylaria longipes]